MPARNAMQTHLASLYHVASNLIRLGFKVVEINKTGKVNIVIEKNKSKKITINVKGLVGISDWPFQPDHVSAAEFFIFVSYDSEGFEDLSKNPEFFIVPSNKIESLIHKWPTWQGVRYSEIVNYDYKNAWNLLEQ